MLHIALIISIVHDIFFLILHEQYCLRRESIIAYLIVGVYGVCCAGRPTTTAIAITAGGTTKLLRKMEIQALDNSQADASSGGGKLILSCIPYFFYVFFLYPSHSLCTSIALDESSTRCTLYFFFPHCFSSC